MSWVFVVTRFAHAGIFVTSNNIQQRSLAWFAGVLVLLAMWIYFALKLSASDLRKFLMTPAARLSAAIELIETIDAQRVPAAKALKEWGTAHRYAGSGDRAAIAGLIWDVLRRRASSAWLMDADTPRARVLGMLRLERGMDADAIATLCDGGRFAPEPLSEAERAALTSRTLDGAPPHIAGDYPEWLDAPSGRKCSAMTAWPKQPRWRAARRSICASTR